MTRTDRDRAVLALCDDDHGVGAIAVSDTRHRGSLTGRERDSPYKVAGGGQEANACLRGAARS